MSRVYTVTLTRKERSYFTRESTTSACEENPSKMKTFNQTLTLDPNAVNAEDLRDLANYVRGMNCSYVQMTQK